MQLLSVENRETMARPTSSRATLISRDLRVKTPGLYPQAVEVNFNTTQGR